MTVDYHGDITPDINFKYNNRNKLLNPPSSYAHRISNIYYTDIVDENNMSIGYEGMRSFAVVKNNLTNDNLQYWLNQKEVYSPGLMKAAFGTFLTSLIVIYENDRVADISAGNFNVVWTRNSPVCVSLCNDYNCLYITGESDHNMGRYTTGDASDIWKFNFATSFSFSLIEQLVSNNIWNTTEIGSVTLGLIENYINNKTLELFTSNNYIFIKNLNDNNTLLFLELGTGIVRDCFSYYGLQGTMPCYHNNITENAWNYGNNILNNNSKSYNDFLNITLFSICAGTLFGLVSSESIVMGESISLVGGTSIAGPLAIILIPVVFEILRPEIANLFEFYGLMDLADYYRTNNTLDMVFDALYYFIFSDASNIPFEQRCFLFIMLTSSFLIHPEYIPFSLSKHNSDLNKLINFITSFSKKQYNYIIQPDIDDVKYTIKNAPAPDDPDLPLGKFAEKLKESFIDLKQCIKNGDINSFFHNSLVIIFSFFCIESLVLHALGKEISNVLKKALESIINDSLP